MDIVHRKADLPSAPFSHNPPKARCRKSFSDIESIPTTWAYLSSLLTIGIYFKFHRFWSVRNLDLVALIGFAPGCC